MSEFLHRHFLKEKEVRRLLADFSQKLKVKTEQLFGPKPHIEQAEIHGTEIFIVNGKPLIARSNELLFPTLMFEEIFHLLPKIVVDMGAVPHICNGAHVMAPGIVRIKGDFQEKDILIILDERHEKPLAIGVALLNSKTAKTLKHGKMAKNIHFVGDKLWDSLKKF